MATRVLVAASTYRGDDWDYFTDGVNDEREINAAIRFVAEAYGGGVVELTAGTFNIDAIGENSSGLTAGIILDQKHGVEITGRGDSTVIHRTGGSYDTVLFNSSDQKIGGMRSVKMTTISGDTRSHIEIVMSQVHFERITFEGGNYGIRVQPSGLTDNYIRNSIFTDQGDTAIVVLNSSRVVVANNIIVSPGDKGIEVDGNNVSVWNNLVASATAEAIYVNDDDVSVIGNTIRDSNEGIELTSSADRTFLSGNHVEGSVTADIVDNGTGTIRRGNSFDPSVQLETVVLDIGDWDMSATVNLSVAHGLTSANIRTIDALVRNDADTFKYNLAAAAEGSSASIREDGTNVLLLSVNGGFFDSTNFDSLSYNRGWITIGYVT